MRIHAALGIVVTGAAVCGAQPATPQEAPATAVRFEDLPAAARLGVRAESLRRRLGVIPTVVLVKDEASYAAAIAAWRMEVDAEAGAVAGAYYPVFIDDGSWQAREDIARFVRAFRPTAVVRWPAGEEKGKLAGDIDAMRTAIESSAFRAWGAASLDELKARWKEQRFAPPGVVVAATADPAWTAALALAAGRGQLFAWTLAIRDPSGSMTAAEAKTLNERIGKACDDAGFGWKGTGDAIDAVTLCMSTPASVKAPDRDERAVFATTDVIGRGVGASAETRWAWAGQVLGNEPRAAYNAMCALFLEPDRAWLFDGYENKEPASRWDASAAAILFEKAGIGTVVNDNGNQSAASWRNRAGGMGLANSNDPEREPGAGVDTGFIAVNTSGYPEFFDLQPGQCRAGDAPFLHVPAAVHFVHSYSAARVGDRNTIAGRFLERGAFAYVGAVHEPFLQAFVPTPLMVERMLALGPWGASVRLDDAPTWKVAIFGDPLWTVGPPAPRVETPLPLEGVSALQDELAPALKENRYADALWILAMQGRDTDAARLTRLLHKDAPDQVTKDVALAGIMPVFRSPGREGAAGSGERLDLIASLASVLQPMYPQIPELSDILWHAAYPSMTRLTEAQVRALAAAMRPELSGRDAIELTGAAIASLGRDRATGVMRELQERMDANARKRVDEALRR